MVFLILSDDVVNNATMHVREPKIATSAAVRQSFMVQTEKVQDCGVQVMQMSRIFDGQ